MGDFFISFFIEVELIYNVLVSGVQQSNSGFFYVFSSDSFPL